MPTIGKAAFIFAILGFGFSFQIEHPAEKKQPANPEGGTRIVESLSALDGGVYLGRSEEKNACLAWLVCLNPIAQKGRLYLPPEVLDLSIATGVNGTILLRSSKAFGDVVYIFELNRLKQSIVGTVSREIGSRSIRQIGKAEIIFEPIQLEEEALTQLSPPYGIYTNRQYHESSGDMAGAELIILRSPNRIFGLLTVFMGVPVGPYYIEQADMARSQITFTIRTIEGRENFSAALSPKGLQLKQMGYKSLGTQYLLRKNPATIFGGGHKTCEEH